jgi:hypothetical protein
MVKEKKSKPAPKDTPNKVSDETLDQSLKLTPEGFNPDSEEAKELEKQRDFLGRIAKPSFQASKDARRKYDQEWIARNLFWRGYQFSRYLPQTQTVVLSGRQNARIPINLVTAYMRAIRNQVTSFRPKWETMPRNSASELDKVQTRYTGRLLDYYWDHLKLKMKTKETITQGLLYSVGGPWKIEWDKQRKKVKISLRDTFDFFIDPLAEEFNDEDPQFCVEAVRQAHGEVVHNQTFNVFARKEVAAGDANLAASEYKQFMIQAIRTISPRTNENSPTVILKDGYFKRVREDGTPYMVRCIWTDQNMTPLFYEEMDGVEEFPFVLYKGDLNPKDVYGEGWIKHVMAVNRVINSLESSTFEYNYRVAKGRIVVDKDSGVKQIHNVHGEIISKNRGSEVKALDMAGLPVAVPQQIERMWHYLEDISGLHEASLGRIPTGVKSGVGIAELKQADATSQDDLVDNLEDFLEEVARKLLKVIAENMDTYQIIRDLGVREGQEKYFVVIGEDHNNKKNKKPVPGHEGQIKMGVDWFDVAEIKGDNHIRVNVGSWLGYTKEAMQQKVIQYYQLQLIDQGTALRLLEFGDIDSIVQKSRVEALLKKPPQMGANGQPQVDQYSLAMSENDMMLDGTVTTPRDAISLVTPDQDHIVHIALHQEALGRGSDEIVGVHIDAHQQFLGVNKPIGGGNGMDVRDNMARGAQAPMPPGPQAPTQPSGMPQPAGMPSAPSPMGLPGQGQPQQNVPQNMAAINENTSENAGGIVA